MQRLRRTRRGTLAEDAPFFLSSSDSHSGDSDDHNAKRKSKAAVTISCADPATNKRQVMRKFTFATILLGLTFATFMSNSTNSSVLLMRKQATDTAITVHVKAVRSQQEAGKKDTATINVRGGDDRKRLGNKIFPAAPFVSVPDPVVPVIETAAAAAVQLQQQEATTPGIEPLDCAQFVQQVHDKTYPVKVNDPNRGVNYTRMTTTEQPFSISVHKEEFDKTRWGIYKDGRYYEKALEKIWSNILKESGPGARVLDVGGNIGYYSLFSASMGEFKVDAFEPNLKNALRFCESLVLNGWKNEEQSDPLAGSSVTVWPAGVSDITGKLQFFENYGNPGAGRFGGFGNKRTDSIEVPVTTLDKFANDRNWFETRPHIAILKVDVERHEANVLVGAEKLLKARIVQNIFTELSLEDPERREIEAAALHLLVEAGYKLAGQGGWSGPGKDSPWTDDDNLVKNIFDYLEKENKLYLNLWWSL